MSDFESCGVALIAPSKRSVRLEIHDSNRVFDDVYYVSIKDLENVLKGRKQTAQIVKIVKEIETNGTAYA